MAGKSQGSSALLEVSIPASLSLYFNYLLSVVLCDYAWVKESLF